MIRPLMIPLLGIVVLAFGCARQPAKELPKQTAKKTPPAERQIAKEQPREMEPEADLEPELEVPNNTAQLAAVPETPQPLDVTMPKLTLSEGHAATCKVKVGDAMPDFQLNDLDGKSQSLADVRGEKLTVVAFWAADRPFAVEELADLGPQVAGQYSSQGVKVVAVNSQDDAAVARREAEAAKVIFPVLLDEGSKLFDQVATHRLPRTYLLDADGKILWFDLEYSRTTRRQLQQAIQAALAGKVN